MKKKKKQILQKIIIGILAITMILPMCPSTAYASGTDTVIYTDNHEFKHTCTSPNGGYDVLEPHTHDASCIHYHEHAYNGTLTTFSASWQNGSTYGGQKCATASGGCYTRPVCYNTYQRYVKTYYGNITWDEATHSWVHCWCVRCGSDDCPGHDVYENVNQYVYLLSCNEPETYLTCGIDENTQYSTLHFTENFCYRPVYHTHTHLGNAITVNGINGYDTSGECYQRNSSHIHSGVGQMVITTNIGANGEDIIGRNMSGGCYTTAYTHVHTNDGIDGNDDVDGDCYEDIMGYADKYTYRVVGSDTTGNACTWLGSVTCADCGQTISHVFTVDTSKIVNHDSTKTINSGVIAVCQPDLSDRGYSIGETFDFSGNIFALYDNELDDFVYNISPYGTNYYFGCCLHGKSSSDPNREQYWTKIGDRLICPIKQYQYDETKPDGKGAEISVAGTTSEPFQVYELSCTQDTTPIYTLSCPKTEGVDIDSYEYCCVLGNNTHLVDAELSVVGENDNGTITTIKSLNITGKNMSDHCIFGVKVINPEGTETDLGTFDSLHNVATFTNVNKAGNYYIEVKCYSYQNDITKLKYEGKYQFKYTVRPFANYVRIYKESITKKDNTTTYPLNNLASNKVTYFADYDANETLNIADYSKTGYTLNGFIRKGDNTTYLYDATGKITYNFLDKDYAKIHEIYANYTPNDYNVSYTLENEIKETPVVKNLVVTYDEIAQIPDDAKVYNGYTFDGWFKHNTSTLSFKPNKMYNANQSIWKETADISVSAKYHPNTYIIKYNNTDITDTNLNGTQNITYDASYPNINIAPYKEGYIFDGHYFKDYANAEQKIWDNTGTATKSIFDFVSNPNDNTVINTYKKYVPKVFDIEIGDDYDEDGVLDNVDITETAEFDKTYFDLPVPAVRYGLTFDGYYILGTDICVAKYDAENDTLTKVSNTWIWDDGTDWNNDPAHNTLIQVESRWSHNKIKVIINTETSDKTDQTVGKSSPYKWSTLERTEEYDRIYKPITTPTKRGYIFERYIVKPFNSGEEETIWEGSGKAKLPTFLWIGDSATINTAVETAKVYVYSVFKQSTIKGNIPTQSYEPKTKTVTPLNFEISQLYDNPYNDLSFIPSKEGYDFDGIKDKDGNLIWDNEGKPVQEVWQYIESDIDDFEIVWKPKTYVLTWDNGNKKQTITFGEKVPQISTMDTPSDPTLSKKGYSFSGYSFDFFGKEIYIFDKEAKFTGNVWNYDVGVSGTEIPLKDLFDANTYTVTVKDGDNTLYTIDCVYGLGYANAESQSRVGYIFEGYEIEGENAYFWNIDGTPVKDTYDYDKDLTVNLKWKPKTFLLHCDDKVIKVTFGELIEAYAPKKFKDSEEDKKTTTSYIFEGWFLDEEKIFDENGSPVIGAWNKDLGEDNTEVYLTDSYSTVVTDKTLGTSNGFRNVVQTIWKNPVGKVVVVTTASFSVGFVIAFIIFLILLLLFAFGQISLLYVYDETAEKKRLKQIIKIKHYRRKEYQKDGVKYYVRLNDKYYNKLLDVNSRLLSVKFAPFWVQGQQGKRFDRKVLFNKEDVKDIRISCKNLYDDFSTASIRTEKGNMDRGFVEVKLTKTFD